MIQRPITERALDRGLATLARLLEQRHPGTRVVFDCGPGERLDSVGEAAALRQACGTLPVPEHQDAPLVERAAGPVDGLTTSIRSARTSRRSLRERPMYAAEVNP